jgi:hypothetical protein
VDASVSCVYLPVYYTKMHYIDIIVNISIKSRSLATSAYINIISISIYLPISKYIEINVSIYTGFDTMSTTT